MVRFFFALWNNYRNYIVAVSLLLVSLVFISLDSSPQVKQLKKYAFSGFAIINYALSETIDFAQGDAKLLELQEENARLMLEVNLLREYGIKNEELKSLLRLRDTLNFPLLPAEIVSKKIDKIRTFFTINVGENQNVNAGMPVITADGLVGIVSDVAAEFSIVRTVQNIDFKVAVKNQRSRVSGVLNWDGSSLLINNIPLTYDMKLGDRIVTSDFSVIVPPSIPVGVVVGQAKERAGAFNQIFVAPYVDITSVENVFIIQLLESEEKNEMELNLFGKN